VDPEARSAYDRRRYQVQRLLDGKPYTPSGRPYVPQVAQTAEERFWAKVDRLGPEECWMWLASTNSKGYGKFGQGGKTRPAHRVAYELVKGPIPEGMVLDHLCQRRRCVNPSHLEPVTSHVNTERGD
jgi:hypothetical protein